jgi:hypothetical protein
MTEAAIWTKCERVICAVLPITELHNPSFYVCSENAQSRCNQRLPSVVRCRTHGTDRGPSIYAIDLSAALTFPPTNQILIELPKFTEDSIAQISRDKHASLAELFSLAVEDIPPMLRKHATAVGLDTVLPWLNFVEKRGGEYVDLCQTMRGHIASHLTEDERLKYLE